ncbi:CLUMA_CG014728, isoform A [Clunio marinus]|uniref:CLUMA_CG014728, isoform A n=1 Tax=Clunio marinus TaxID=568069 RepID=A0A1J1IQX4_9DIPT|nr:CLUMA_CG014728, isoform A [Clunio marinus]
MTINSSNINRIPLNNLELISLKVTILKAFHCLQNGKSLTFHQDRHRQAAHPIAVIESQPYTEEFLSNLKLSSVGGSNVLAFVIRRIANYDWLKGAMEQNKVPVQTGTT